MHMPRVYLLWYDINMRSRDEKEKAILLRKNGKTYPEIQNALGLKVPKATLFYWFKNIKLTAIQEKRIRKQNLNSLKKTRQKALASIKKKRELYLKSITDRVCSFNDILEDKRIGKVVLSMLYITEGSRTSKSSISFGNSDPYIISLFLHLLRFCYTINEQKLRCTVQCRADQNIAQLENFWKKITGITRERFCKPQIDMRTLGKPTKKQNYKGVCRIYYYSADLLLELRAIAEVIYNGPMV